MAKIRFTDIAAVRMGKLITIPAGLICASITVHAAKEEEYKKQLVKPERLPEQPGHLQMGFASICTTTDFLPEVGVITVSGLIGLKIAYPLGLATLRVTGKKTYTTSEQIYEAVKSLWTNIQKIIRIHLRCYMVYLDPKLMGHGQSHPEDVDMYSTRS
ncbi:unnamed protein product [Nyctereutes procyonoides]|uniref:(raccoon dog) hypothetical protein n=1 Tax=Nyctereutes procyonoides TaxID=34880 RepID=A0A811ZXS6_NYCPR|nr:unnamed protein product [Nyctereutes procyonoides]